MLSYVGRHEELAPFYEQIVARWVGEVAIHFTPDHYLRGYYFLEIGNCLANKRSGLELWSALVGCAPSDVTVFGDNLNDIDMFQVAGTKVAVANAHPKVKELATQVVVSNNEDGVARYIAADTLHDS